MRLLLVAWGSRGDVAPFVALGRGLRAAGHDVTVAAADGFADVVQGAGLGYRRFAISLDASSTDPVFLRWLAGSDSLTAELRNMRAAAETFGPVLAEGLAGMVDDADGIVSGLLSLDALAPWARAHGRPLVAALLQPMLPTRCGVALTHPALPGRRSAANLAAGWWQASGMYSLLHRPLRQAHAALGVPHGGVRGYLRTVMTTPTVVGVSPLVVPQPDDWPPHAQVCGYWPDPVPDGYRPPVALTGFLTAGPAPVYLGFGSMPAADAPGLRSTVLAAVRRAGVRAVLGGSLHAGADAVREWTDGVVSVSGLPHGWLFSRTAGVVCHGGSGTVGAGLRAGVPVGVVSHMGDQHYWGRRVHELGVGPAPLHRVELDATRLTGLLHGLRDPGVVERAARLGTALRAEDGVARAVAFIQEVLG